MSKRSKKSEKTNVYARAVARIYKYPNDEAFQRGEMDEIFEQVILIDDQGHETVVEEILIRPGAMRDGSGTNQESENK